MDYKDQNKVINDLHICVGTLKQFTWLLNSYILDYFTEDHIKLLPSSWIHFFDSLSLSDLGKWMIEREYTIKTSVPPLSLQCLRALSQQIQLCRNSNYFENKLPNKTEKERINNSFKNVIKEECQNKSIVFQNAKLQNIFCKHVKPKKRYEILKLAEITHKAAKEVNVRCVIDIGSGLGHLSRTLSYGYNLKVCGIESQKKLIQQASILDVELETTASKHLSEDEMVLVRKSRPTHIEETISFKMDEQHLLDILTKALGVAEPFGIVGLHPCGDLAAILLKLFLQCENARFINLVGCCYHKLSVSSENKVNFGFPLSNHVQSMKFDLSYEARALGCHAIETYCDRLRTNEYDYLKVHCYRATLETIIKKYWPHHRKTSLNSVRHTPQLSFSEYCKKALKKLDVQVPEEEFARCECYLSRWKEVVAFYSIRLMLAPFVEMIILFDRFLYLTETGIDCHLFPAFHPEISPRNQIMITKKT